MPSPPKADMARAGALGQKFQPATGLAGTLDNSMNYYNEFDPKSAAWLRELIGSGLIPNGVVDERSITEVIPDDLRGFIQCHFFAGIAGWELALELAGWPADRPVWTGSCPCQPFSNAGKGFAQKDERHLWPVFFNLIRQCRPEHVFGEQVASAIGHGWLDGVSADLEAEGYACGATVLGAHSVSAPHQRQRLYWVAHAHNAGSQRRISGELQEYADQCATRKSSASDGLAHDEGSELQRERAVKSGMQGGPANGGGLVFSDCDGCEQGRPAATSAGHGNPADAAGFWSDFQLVHCRDGKTRRVPTEPLLQRVANGIPIAVDFMRNIVGTLKTQIVHHAKKTDSTAIKTLREMQYAFWAEAIQWDSRGRIGLLSPEILLAALCQLEGELGGVELSSAQSVIQAQVTIMLSVRNNAAKQTASRSPQGREYAQQFARELSDALHELSYENTLEAAQSIFDRASGFPLTTKCPARTTLLRGYGNAIVPQVAAVFIQEFLRL